MKEKRKKSGREEFPIRLALDVNVKHKVKNSIKSSDGHEGKENGIFRIRFGLSLLDFENSSR